MLSEFRRFRDGEGFITYYDAFNFDSELTTEAYSYHNVKTDFREALVVLKNIRNIFVSRFKPFWIMKICVVR